MKRSENYQNKSSRFFNNGGVIFFLGPLIFLPITAITGFSIFYNRFENSKERTRVIMLLSSGTAFYLILTILLAYLCNLKS